MRARLRPLGWIDRALWVRKEWQEKVSAEAARLGVAKSAVWLAVLETGLRYFRPTDVMLAQQRWRERVDLPRNVRIKNKSILIEHDARGRFVAHRVA